MSYSHESIAFHSDVSNIRKRESGFLLLHQGRGSLDIQLDRDDVRMKFFHRFLDLFDALPSDM